MPGSFAVRFFTATVQMIRSRVDWEAKQLADDIADGLAEVIESVSRH